MEIINLWELFSLLFETSRKFDENIIKFLHDFLRDWTNWIEVDLFLFVADEVFSDSLSKTTRKLDTIFVFPFALFIQPQCFRMKPEEKVKDRNQTRCWLVTFLFYWNESASKDAKNSREIFTSDNYRWFIQFVSFPCLKQGKSVPSFSEIILCDFGQLFISTFPCQIGQQWLSEKIFASSFI